MLIRSSRCSTNADDLVDLSMQVRRAHMPQTQSGPVAEVSQTMHQQFSRTLHINPRTVPSGIDRRAFDTWRREYWRWRAADF